MTAHKWTPGPWAVVALSGVGGPYAIRQPYDDKRKYYGVQCVARKEDAQLMAAAPELYEAMEKMLVRLKTVSAIFSDHSALADALREYEAAMAKARGEDI